MLTLYFLPLKAAAAGRANIARVTLGLWRPTLFHRHADYLLGHIPPMYSPIYKFTIGTYTNQHVDLERFIPPSFTTPMTAAAARVYAPLAEDYMGNPWLVVLGHG